MSVVATTGVGVLARLINRLGSGEAMTAASFAAREGFARSTVFDVTRRMEDAGLLQRDPSGTLMPGPALVLVLSVPAASLEESRRDIERLRLLHTRLNPIHATFTVAPDLPSEFFAHQCRHTFRREP